MLFYLVIYDHCEKAFLKFMKYLLFLMCYFFLSLQVNALDKLTIGVLAYNGKQQAIERWQPTADYLKEQIQGYQFHIEPLTHEEFKHAINKGKLDFILTNPGHYVRLEVAFGVTRIATFKSKFDNKVFTKFSSVIFTKSDSDINVLEDLSGHSFAAVSEEAFGGFQLAQKALKDKGVDALKEMNLLWLGFPHKDVVKAVIDGKADAGTVRSGILERMAANGSINLSNLKVINNKEDVNFPILHSVGLYPEWPFSKLPRTDSGIAKKVAIALFNMKENEMAAQKSLGAGWTIPLEYTSVHDVFRSLQIEPYPPSPLNFNKFWQAYYPWIILVSLLFLSSILILFRFIRTNNQLKSTQQTLFNYQSQLENKVRKRTEELHQSNEALQEDISARIKSEQTLSEGCDALQSLYIIALRNDLTREQRLQSLVDMVRHYLGSEYALLSSFESDQFKPCTVSPANQELVVPLSQSYSMQAIHDQQIIHFTDNDDWKNYIACPVYFEGKLHCLLEFATTHHYEAESNSEKAGFSSELSRRILNLVSQWVGNEIIMHENEKNAEDEYKDFIGHSTNITPREWQVLALLVQGESTKSIAKLLNLSAKTIELHRSNLLKKTETKSSIELVKLTVLSGILNKAS